MKKPETGITGIYKITNPNGKVYIGKSKDIITRYYKYNNLKCENQKIIYDSLKKYGPGNHIFDIIEECDISSLSEREIFHKTQMIKTLGKDNILFCFIDDGEAGPKIQSPDSNVKRSRSLKEYYINNNHSMKNKKRDIEFKIKHYKPILQYDLNGNFIKEWPSQLEVYNILKIDINSCLQKKYKTSGGFQWIYKKENILLNIGRVKGKIKRTEEHCINISKNKIGKGLKSILQYDLNGNFIKEWPSQSCVSKELNFNISAINLCLTGKSKTSNGFQWIYKN
jgi:group I intron endonuclease